MTMCGRTRGKSVYDEKIYVVQTGNSRRTLHLDGHRSRRSCARSDLRLRHDGHVAEQWGRRWITIDTSRVALALARARVMGAQISLLSSRRQHGRPREGRGDDREAAGRRPTHGDIRQGFVYERAPHITLKSIANNAEIDVIWEELQAKLEPLRRDLNAALGKKWEEWEIPREADAGWSDNVKGLHAAWWEQRIARQKKIDDSIAKKADVELLYDRPYEDKSRVRVAGPFTVESLSPHRVVPSSEEN